MKHIPVESSYPLVSCMLVRILPFIWLLIVFIPICAAAGQQPAGYVSAVRGEVYAIDAHGVTRGLKIKDPVAVDDLIVTEEKGRVKIVFRDDTIVTLGENSRVKLTSYSWSKERKKGKFKVTINEGLFRIIGGKITKSSPEAFVARTPAASIGIRGSAYAGSVKGKKLSVYLLSGKGIDVSNNKGSVALLRPGLGTTVADAYSAPTAPRPFDASELYPIESGSTLGNDVTSGGSTIGPNGIIVNQAIISNSVNVAVGTDNAAHMGSIKIENSEVKGAVVNQARIKNSANVSAGSGNKALMGSTNVE